MSRPLTEAVRRALVAVEVTLGAYAEALWLLEQSRALRAAGHGDYANELSYEAECLLAGANDAMVGFVSRLDHEVFGGQS